MTEVVYDENATDKRFKELQIYCKKVARIDPHDFHCGWQTACEREVENKGLQLLPGGLAHVGEQYDMRFDEKDLRVMFVGFDFGNDCAGLEKRRQDIQNLEPLNRHYKGIVKVMMEILQQSCERVDDSHLWRPLLKRIAQTNSTRCCAPSGGKRG